MNRFVNKWNREEVQNVENASDPPGTGNNKRPCVNKRTFRTTPDKNVVESQFKKPVSAPVSSYEIQ
jgi:hypothetical protein